MQSVVVNSSQSPSRKRRYSEIYPYFEVVEGGLRKCQKCDKVFQPTTSTGSLKSHLRKKHKLFLEPEAPRAEEGVVVEEKLVRLVAVHAISPTTLESEEFRDFLAQLPSGWKPPSHEQLSTQIIPKIFGLLKRKIAEITAHIEHYALSFDEWASLTNFQYLTVMFHGITNDWRPISFEMGTRSIASETAPLIAETVREILSTWSRTTDKANAIVANSGTHLTSACTNELQIAWVQCFAQALNTAICAGFATSLIQPILNKARAISAFFRQSTKAANILRTQQQLQYQASGLPAQKLSLDCNTRWKGTFKMIQRLVDHIRAVQVALNTMREANVMLPEAELAMDEWHVLIQLCGILKPFAEVSDIVANSRYATLGVVLAAAAIMQTRVLIESTGDLPAIREFKTEVNRALSERYHYLHGNIPQVLLLSIYLDPRAKNFEFISDELRRAELVCSARAALEAELRSSSQSAAAASATAPPPSASSFLNSIFQATTLCPPTAGHELDTELDAYAQARQIPAIEVQSGQERFADPLLWWKAHEQEFPSIVRVVRRYLCIPASSAACERLFSKAGWAMHKNRAKMSHEDIEYLAFIAYNSRHFA